MVDQEGVQVPLAEVPTDVKNPCVGKAAGED